MVLMKRIYFVSIVCLIIAGVVALPASAITRASPALSVNVSANRKPISPLIYGTNYAEEALANEIDVTVNRWGGNIVTRYNWQIDAYNAGAIGFLKTSRTTMRTHRPCPMILLPTNS